MSAASFDHAASLARLAAEEFDVLVVGGGVTGAGVALDAAARGLRVALVERHDLASGTSSRSSKLVHGGLRYLQQKEYALVYENLAERQRLLLNAPHLVQPLPFLIPLFGKDGVVNKTVAKAYSTALWLYDLTGGIRIGHRHRRIDVHEVVEHLPVVRREAVVAGFLYYDAQADDARLTLALARTAALRFGATVVTHVAVTGMLKEGNGRVRGVRLADGTEVRARCVVNAAGVWADEVRALDEGRSPGTIRPAKGVHVTVPWSRVRCDIAAVIPVPHDRRSIFVIPWNDLVYLGTTDTDYDGPLDDPQCTPEDVAYILGALNAFSREPLDESDVVGTWAGLRPLVRGAASGRTADLSRRHRVLVSDGGVVTITGGKLTTYRKMAADTVDEVVRLVGRGSKRTPTKALPLWGAEGTAALREDDAAARLSVDRELLAHLVGRYGGEARAVLAMAEDDLTLGVPLVPGLPYLRAEAVFAVRYEMARTLDDILSRRTRARLLARDASAAAAPDVARLVAGELGWSDADIDREVESYRSSVERERAAAELPHSRLPA